eukprot:6548968-Prymnesium_polylepis.1
MRPSVEPRRAPSVWSSTRPSLLLKGADVIMVLGIPPDAGSLLRLPPVFAPTESIQRNPSPELGECTISAD